MTRYRILIVLVFFPSPKVVYNSMKPLVPTHSLSTELPWFTRVFRMVNRSMSTPLKSSSVKVMGGILGRNVTAFA